LDDEDGDNALFLYRVGKLFQELGEYDFSLEMQKRSLALREQIFRIGYIRTTDNINEISSVLTQKEKYDDAVQ